MFRTALISAICIGTSVCGDVLVEFSLYTDTQWTEKYRVADVSMTIEGLDLMGYMPEGGGTYQAEILLFPTWPGVDFYSGEITGWLSNSGKGWGGLGFDFGEFALTQYGDGGNSISMEWASMDDGEGEFAGFSYGLATWQGGFAEYVGVDFLYLGWPINENTIPAECLADIDSSGEVDVSDLLAVIDQWGSTDSDADISGDGIVNVTDLLEVVGNWGPCE
jgi:hypothetical protein